MFSFVWSFFVRVTVQRQVLEFFKTVTSGLTPLALSRVLASRQALDLSIRC